MTEKQLIFFYKYLPFAVDLCMKSMDNGVCECREIAEQRYADNLRWGFNE